jgi:hypothetical protein
MRYATRDGTLLEVGRVARWRLAMRFFMPVI